MAKKEKNPNKKKHKKVEVWKFYEVKEGQLVRKKKLCPKCKNFLAETKGREYCGFCGYAVIYNQEKPKEEIKGLQRKKIDLSKESEKEEKPIEVEEVEEKIEEEEQPKDKAELMEMKEEE